MKNSSSNENDLFTFQNIARRTRALSVDDFLMFRVVISGLTGSDRMKRWPVNFIAKGYPNRNHSGTVRVRRRNEENLLLSDLLNIPTPW
jgi:hypothetical protein